MKFVRTLITFFCAIVFWLALQATSSTYAANSGDILSEGTWKGHRAVVNSGLDASEVLSFLNKTAGCYLGAYLGCGSDDLSCESIQEFNQKMGKPHAIFARYIDIKDSTNQSHWEWAEEVVKNGAMPMFIYDPWDELDTIDMSDVEYFASKCKELNKAVFIVFGHEMNLPFYPWGNQPENFKEKFKEVAEVFHRVAPNAEMCWVPNQNWGYPWGGVNYGDGYTEYYPEGIGLYGEYVDWVGLDFYEKDWDEDNLIPQDMFIANIKNGQDGVDFYEKFSAGNDKPMLIAETGAFDSNEDLTAAGERNPLSDAEQTNFRSEWIKQVYDVSTLKDEIPRLNAICYFHVSKIETIDTKTHSFPDIAVDYRIPEAPNVYKGLISDPYFIGEEAPNQPPSVHRVGLCDQGCQEVAPLKVSGGELDVCFNYTGPVNILAGVLSDDFKHIWWLRPDCSFNPNYSQAVDSGNKFSCEEISMPVEGGYLFWLVSPVDLSQLDWENGIYELLFYQVP